MSEKNAAELNRIYRSSVEIENDDLSQVLPLLIKDPGHLVIMLDRYFHLMIDMYIGLEGDDDTESMVDLYAAAPNIFAKCFRGVIRSIKVEEPDEFARVLDWLEANHPEQLAESASEDAEALSYYGSETARKKMEALFKKLKGED